ncbi:hypothetical protein PsorP6_001381 [Peronosclerospora sorghi]|uniref:Uncharacterized protein n=1 Tax=Peronosclerospora sorghi TaxID=230839 RepID=A0ACC0WT03_9STRA|nr:hypothetical protein PsorP6_001381 [Peronosclerospora sorghi]
MVQNQKCFILQSCKMKHFYHFITKRTCSVVVASDKDGYSDVINSLIGNGSMRVIGRATLLHG